jgi:L-ribulokinase
MASTVCKTYTPNAQAAAAYEGLYQKYLTLGAFVNSSPKLGGSLK